METEVQKTPGRPARKNIILISLLVFILLMLGITAQFTYTVLKNEKIYNGVYIDSFHAGNLTREELEQALTRQYRDAVKDLSVTLKTEKTSVTVPFKDFETAYDIRKAADEAYNIGRTGNIFSRLYDIYQAGKNNVTLNIQMKYNKDLMDKVAEDFYRKTLVNVKEADILIQDEAVTVRSGHHGENIDKKLLVSKLHDLVLSHKGGELQVETIRTPPSKLDIEELFTQISREPADAHFKVENNNTFVVPHVLGRKIEKATLESIAAELEAAENTEKVLPVEFIEPEITTEDAYALLFKDTVATMSTHFSTATQNDKSRGINIRLAASKINGKILAPGEDFSFNGIVGQRTVDGGYQVAHAYRAGKVVDDIGGGICQVSSTLYNAILKADLEVVERRNHQFTVGYVPKGQDATVNYGTTDFRFRNSTRWPIKIIAGVTKDNNVFFTIKGTVEDPSKTVVITSQIVKTVPFETKYIDDPTLPEGKTSVKQEGKTGHIVNTFKTIKVNGKVVSQTKVHTSTYKPLTQEILKGTKKVSAPATTATPKETKPASNEQPSGNTGNTGAGTTDGTTAEEPLPPLEE